ncbi:MAG: TatD family nuclease-associated radical SAM protein [archaeon]|nr:TatD family nuclease-associated radical SAM protein [archaeon]
MSIVYRYGRNLYINLTNKCPCSCIFCIRDSTPRLGDADSLWLKEEPSAEDVIRELRYHNLMEIHEIVFCGYGEPTERLDVLLEIADRIHTSLKKNVRLDTNGLGNLLNGRDIVPDLAKALDSISISLNAPDAESYKRITRCRFDGQEAFDSLIGFIKGCRVQMDDVTVSIVGGYLSTEDEERSQRLADELGVDFRVR